MERQEFMEEEYLNDFGQALYWASGLLAREDSIANLIAAQQAVQFIREALRKACPRGDHEITFLPDENGSWDEVLEILYRLEQVNDMLADSPHKAETKMFLRRASNMVEQLL